MAGTALDEVVDALITEHQRLCSPPRGGRDGDHAWDEPDRGPGHGRRCPRGPRHRGRRPRCPYPGRGGVVHSPPPTWRSAGPSRSARRGLRVSPPTSPAHRRRAGGADHRRLGVLGAALRALARDLGAASRHRNPGRGGTRAQAGRPGPHRRSRHRSGCILVALLTEWRTLRCRPRPVARRARNRADECRPQRRRRPCRLRRRRLGRVARRTVRPRGGEHRLHRQRRRRWPVRGGARPRSRLALDGGPDGLAAYRTILAQVPPLLVPGGHLLVEIGYDQEAALRQLAADHGLRAEVRRRPRRAPRVVVP